MVSFLDNSVTKAIKRVRFIRFESLTKAQESFDPHKPSKHEAAFDCSSYLHPDHLRRHAVRRV